MITRIKTASSNVKHFKLKLAVAVIALICCTATTVFAASAMVTAYVYCDNEITRVVSFSADTDEIITKAGIVLGDADVVCLDSFTGETGGVIYVHKAHNVSITDGSKTHNVLAAGTVSDALEKAGVVLETGDRLSVDKSVFLTEGMSIVVERCFGVTVVADGSSRSFSFFRGTVSDALDESGISLGEHDTVSLSLNKALDEDMKIVVQRVTYSKRTAKEAIAFNTKTVKSSSLYVDQKKVTTEGVSGERTLHYVDKYVDGKLVKSFFKSSEVTKQPVDKVVTVGTKRRPVAGITAVSPSRSVISVLTPPSPIELDENGRPVNYRRVIRGKATAYYGGTLTSTGVRPLPGRVAVDPDEIPYGTKMYIVSSDGKFVYGYSVAADTGGFAWNGSGTLVDLYMNSYSQCVNFGRRTVEVYIL